jgi:thymidylate kinase
MAPLGRFFAGVHIFSCQNKQSGVESLGPKRDILNQEVQMPKFFAVDGPTGVGKSEVMKYLRANLWRHELGCPQEQILLFWTSRLATCKQLARLIKDNKIPITLRFGASTWAHQVYYHDRVADLDEVHWDMVRMCVLREGLVPPHYLMLTAPSAILHERISSGPKGSPFPKSVTIEERLMFLKRLQEGYEAYAHHPSQTATVIDASVTIEQMGEKAVQAIITEMERDDMLKNAA